MGIFNTFKTDKAAEESGVWVMVDDGEEICIARHGNAKHKAIVEELTKPYRAILRAGGEIPDAKTDEIALEATARALLIDWRGIKDEAGEPLPYSVEAAKKVLTELPEFRNRVVQMSMTFETFRTASLEDLEKKSKK